MRPAACLLATVVLATSVGAGQSQPPTVKTTTAGVLIDVTVLDNKGQPVTNLGPADFELKEEGKTQQVLSVTLVQRGVVKPSTG